MFSALQGKRSQIQFRWFKAPGKKPAHLSAFRPCLEAFEDRLLLSTYLVTNTDDTGAGSLRQAIMDANSHGGQATIAFNIPGNGVHTIQPASPLPDTRGTVVIDGTTQNGYTGSPLIELDGSKAGSSYGLAISGNNSTVKGLAINNFNGAGIGISGGSRIIGNYIGTDATGTIAKGNGVGVSVFGSSNSIGGTTPETRTIISGNDIGVDVEGFYNQIQGNYIGTNAMGTVALGNNVGIFTYTGALTVGGLVAGAGNLISGNLGAGIALHNHTQGTLVAGNLIGTDATGTVALGNRKGVEIYSGPSSESVIIGGIQPEAANVISGNQEEGVYIQGVGRLTHGYQVIGNWIGTDATGSINLGNGGDGVALVNVWGSTVGGTAPNSGNVIGYNGGDGVRVDNAISAIQGNEIFASSNLGIELLNGANHDQAFPDISYATTDGTSTTIAGTLNSSPNTDYTLEFFASFTCNPSGYGEGEQLLGTGMVRTNSQGTVDFSITLNSPVDPSQFITATSTSSSTADTSQFSACVAVSPGAPGSSRHLVPRGLGTFPDEVSPTLDRQGPLVEMSGTTLSADSSGNFARVEVDRFFGNLSREHRSEDGTGSFHSLGNSGHRRNGPASTDCLFSLENDPLG